MKKREYEFRLQWAKLILWLFAGFLVFFALGGFTSDFIPNLRRKAEESRNSE